MAYLIRQFVPVTMLVMSLSGVHAGPLPDWSTHNGNASHTGYVDVVLNPVDFKPQWTAKLPSTFDGYNTAATGAGAAYVSSKGRYQIGHLYALELKSGKVRWVKEFRGKSGEGVYSLTAAAYSSGGAYVTTGGHEDAALWRYEAATGGLQFSAPIASQAEDYLAPTPFGKFTYINGGEYGGAYSFESKSGIAAWFKQLPQYDSWTPAVDAKNVYAYTTQLDIIDRSSGEIVKSIPDRRFNWIGYSVGNAPAIGSNNNIVVTQANRLVSFDLLGDRVAWERPVGPDGELVGQVTLAHGTIYHVRGNAVALRNESDGQLIRNWRVPGGGLVKSNVLATNNMFFVSTTKGTFAANINGEPGYLWQHKAQGQLSLSSEGLLIITANEGTVTAIKLLPNT